MTVFVVNALDGKRVHSPGKVKCLSKIGSHFGLKNINHYFDCGSVISFSCGFCGQENVNIDSPQLFYLKNPIREREKNKFWATIITTE